MGVTQDELAAVKAREREMMDEVGPDPAMGRCAGPPAASRRCWATVASTTIIQPVDDKWHCSYHRDLCQPVGL